MSTQRLATAELVRLFDTGSLSGLTEWELLEKFLTHRDELAFQVLVSRHGPMVLGICRRMLANAADVEDAFQATFLVLLKRAGSLGPGDAVAAWLHGVAVRVAQQARGVAARRRRREHAGVAVEVPRKNRPSKIASCARSSTRRSSGCLRNIVRRSCSATSKGKLTRKPRGSFSGRWAPSRAG